jgi:hypothetical protein
MELIKKKCLFPLTHVYVFLCTIIRTSLSIATTKSPIVGIQLVRVVVKISLVTPTLIAGQISLP